MTWGPRYKGDIDDRMWGAPRRIGKVIGGLPLKVFHELVRDLVPGDKRPVTKVTHFFKKTELDMTIEFLHGEPVVIPRATVAAWLEEHYPGGHRLGYVHGELGTNYP